MIDKLWILVACSAIALLVAYLYMKSRADEADAINKEAEEEERRKEKEELDRNLKNIVSSYAKKANEVMNKSNDECDEG